MHCLTLQITKLAASKTLPHQTYQTYPDWSENSFLNTGNSAAIIPFYWNLHEHRRIDLLFGGFLKATGVVRVIH